MKIHDMTRAALLITAVLLTAGCGRKAESVEMGPAETLEAFFRSVSSGDFASAAALCDTLSMKDYISAYAEALNMQSGKDSSVAAIAAGILSEAEIMVDEVVRDNDRRLVHYTIDAGDELNKKKTATLKKDEGAWRVEKITDRQ